MKILFKSKTIILGAVIIIAWFHYSCSNGNEKASEDEGNAPVKVVNPVLTNMNDYLIMNATTIFQKKEIIRATFQGFIVKFDKKIGDQIDAGDEILQTQTKESAADGSMDISLEKASFKGLVSVKAKTRGILTEQNHNIGDFISDGDQIAVVSDPSSLIIELNVPYQSVSKIKLGSSCLIDLPNGEAIAGSIYKILPSVDQSAQTQLFLIQLKQINNLPENLNVTVKIPMKIISNALTIPKTALMTDETQSKFWVMKLINDSTAVKVDVLKGIENEGHIQVLSSSITMKDRIISEGAFGLPDTAKVIIGK